MITLSSPSPTATHAIAGAIARLVRAGDLVVLAGEMGSGKTWFTKGFAAALGVTDPVTSPTFTLVHSYAGGRLPVHHVDVYRLDRAALETIAAEIGPLPEDIARPVAPEEIPEYSMCPAIFREIEPMRRLLAEAHPGAARADH